MKKVQLKYYQKLGVFQMVHAKKGRALLADDPGLGKSVQAIKAALPLRRKKPIIIICPSTVKWSWEDEIKLQTGMQCWVLEGRKPPRRRPLYLPPFIVLNWDILDAWANFLIRLKPGVVIPDEVHLAKNRRAKRTKALKRLCRKVPHILCLTGTPIENRPADIFVSLNLLRPDIFKTFLPFGMKFCKPRRTPWGMDFSGASNTQKLNRLLKKTVMIRRTKKEVLKELPPVTRVMVPLDIDRKKYERAENDIYQWLIENKKSIRGIVNAPGFAKFSHLLQLAAELKLPGVIQWVEEFLENTGEKLVVFGYHHKFLRPLHKHFANESVLIDGTVKGRKRKAAIEEFVSVPSKRVCLANIIAAGTGVNKLQHAASNVAIGELIWVPTKLNQAIARLDRLGQTTPVTAHFLTARDTVEYSLCRALWKKQAIIDEVVDGKVAEKQDFDVFASLVKNLRQRKR